MEIPHHPAHAKNPPQENDKKVFFLVLGFRSGGSVGFCCLYSAEAEYG